MRACISDLKNSGVENSVAMFFQLTSANVTCLVLETMTSLL